MLIQGGSDLLHFFFFTPPCVTSEGIKIKADVWECVSVRKGKVGWGGGEKQILPNRRTGLVLRDDLGAFPTSD